MIELNKLQKKFGPIVAVESISMRVGRGEVLGFLGPNGAGKSTTMKMVTGYLWPTSGNVTVDGFDVEKDPLAIKQRIGYLPEGAPAYPDMTPRSFLRWVGQVRGLKGRARTQRIDEIVERVQLRGVMRQPIDTLSKGYKRRVGLAQALLHDPDVLILDEPTDGLDPNQKHEVRQLIRRLGDDKCVILSTHILEEVDAVCTRAVVIAKGKIVADDKPEMLRARSRSHNTVYVRLPSSQLVMARKLSELPEIEDVHYTAKTNPRDVTHTADDLVECRIVPRKKESIAVLVNDTLRSYGATIHEMRIDHGKLDDVFRQLTTSASTLGGGH